MRRKDRERDAAFALEVLRDCEYAAFATVNTDGKTPYCILISPVLINNSVYFHCAKEGQKIDNIKKNNSVCISCARNTKLVGFTTEYESAVVFGKCEIVPDENETEKIMALRAIGEKYAKDNMHNFEAHTDKFLSATCICRVDIEKITGKEAKVKQ